MKQYGIKYIGLIMFLLCAVTPRPAVSEELIAYTMTQLRIFAVEDDTDVTVTNLANGSVYASFTLAAESDDWSQNSGVPNYVSISSDKKVIVFTGKALPDRNDWGALIMSDNGTKLGDEFHGFTEYHLWIFASRESSYPPTEIEIVDVSDGDDSTTLTAADADLSNTDVECYHLTGFEYDTLHITSNIPISVLAGSSMIHQSNGWAYISPSVALGEDGSELGTHFFGYTTDKLSVYAFEDGTNVTITDLSDGDDSKNLLLDSNSIYSVENPAAIRPGVDWQSNSGNWFDADYFEVESDKPVLAYVGPTYDPGGQFVLDFAPAVPTGPESIQMITYANRSGVELLTFDATTNVTITSLSSSGTFHDYTIAPNDWNGVGPFYWEAPLDFNQEMLRIQADKPISVFYGDFYPGWFTACCSASFLPVLPEDPTLDPVANAGPDQDVYLDETVSFSGTGFDPDGGDIVLYEWDFDGDGTYDWSSTEHGSTTHLYEDPDLYNAVLRVTDDEDETDTDICEINVTIRPPIPAFGPAGVVLLLGILGGLLCLKQKRKI